jgi:hypothetical protein
MEKPAILYPKKRKRCKFCRKLFEQRITNQTFCVPEHREAYHKARRIYVPMAEYAAFVEWKVRQEKKAKRKRAS